MAEAGRPEPRRIPQRKGKPLALASGQDEGEKRHLSVVRVER